MNRINREEFLRNLESVEPGLSPREILEQSSCFIFQKGWIKTFNDEVACKIKSPLKLEGAVQAAPLLAILRKLEEEEIEVSAADGEIVVKGKKRSAGIRMEADIQLPVENVENPGEWNKLHSDFADAVELVSQCAGRDESTFVLTCIHLHPKWIEACNDVQSTRYRIPTGVKEAILIRSKSLQHITPLGMTEFSETDTWIHFRNPSGLVLSCRRMVEAYPSLKKLFQMEGTPFVLPKRLAEAAENAAIFSAENPDDDEVTVTLKSGKLRVEGRGASGWYRETKKVKYDGEPLAFMAPPKLLVELTKRYNDCFISHENTGQKCRNSREMNPRSRNSRSRN
jgi:DNA polymerase III sliding clamp (beta) subunit (PCNA family)